VTVSERRRQIGPLSVGLLKLGDGARLLQVWLGRGRTVREFKLRARYKKMTRSDERMRSGG
jgi:hypothetical protein